MFDGPLASELDPAERRARLRLTRSARIGPVTFHEALEHFGSARAACARLATVSDAEVAREEEALARAGGGFLVIGDPAYPATLAALPDAPPVLSAIGDLGLLGEDFIDTHHGRGSALEDVDDPSESDHGPDQKAEKTVERDEGA